MPGAHQRRSRPRTTRSSRRRACAPASTCSSTALQGAWERQLAELGHAAGAEVTATVRNPEFHAAVAALGADRVVAPDGFERHGPYDVILELIGAPNFAANVEALALWGRIALIGIGAGLRAEIDIARVMSKRATIRGSTLRSRTLEEKATAARAVERQVLRHVASGAVRVPVAATFGLEQAPAAYERFAAGAKLGKIVVATS